MKTQKLGPFLGINDRLPDFALNLNTRQASGDYLRVADNVEITNKGTINRRRKETLVQAMTGAHSLHGEYLVRDSVMYRVTLPTYSETLFKVLTSNAPVSYVDFNGSTYYSNGTDSGRIEQGLHFPMALPTPAQPASSVIGGSLFKGKYQVAVSYLNSVTGEEGGVSASSNPELSAVGGLRINLPATTAGATHVNVYVSTVNGSIPMLQATVATGTATVDVTALKAGPVDGPQPTGREFSGRFEDPLPAGTLFMFNNQLCSVKGKDLFYGIPYRPGYYLPSEGQIPFPEDVSIAIGNQQGLYVAADKTYFLAGTQLGAELTVRDVLPYGAVPGTAFAVPNKSTVGWFGHKGLVLADTQGEVQAVMSDNIDLTPPASGIATVFETRGYRRVVSCGWCVNLDNLAATTYSSYDFTSTSDGYGTKADGLYLLEGAGLADSLIGFGKQDFGSENEKHMPAVYLGCSGDSPLELSVTTPDDEDYRYLARSNGETLDIHRVDPGKGLKANWFDLAIRNTDGSDFTLASVSFSPAASTRRI